MSTDTRPSVEFVVTLTPKERDLIVRAATQQGLDPDMFVAHLAVTMAAKIVATLCADEGNSNAN